MKACALLSLCGLPLTCLCGHADAGAPEQTCGAQETSSCPGTRGAALLQTGQRRDPGVQANVGALQELLPPRAGGAPLQRAPPQPQRPQEPLPVEWWDETLTKAPLYVKPTWGLANRLRTIAGAFAAGRAVGRNVAVIWERGPQCPQELTELFEGVALARSPPPDARTLSHGHRCEYRPETPLELAQVPADRPIYVSGCDFAVRSLADKRHLAFHAMYLQPALRAEVKALVTELRRPGRHAIGVHIRQGSLQDARQGSFFGKFQKPPAGMTEIPCCTESAPHWVCPGYARPLSSYLAAMQKRRTTGGSPVFYVASDRPACVRLLERPGDVRVLHSRLPGTDRSGRNNATAALVDMYALAACGEMMHKDPGSWTGLIRSIHEGFGHFADGEVPASA